MATLPPNSTVGNFPYHIVRRLSKPGQVMSEVYLATVGKATTLQPYPPQVALKIARTQGNELGQLARDALKNEEDRLRRLHHPNIVPVLPIHGANARNPVYFAQSDLEGRPWFFVMEFLQGGSLDDLIVKRKGLDLGLALEIMLTLATTLDYIHSRQQVHMDIKAENILFRFNPVQTRRVEPVFIDFGIARYIGQEVMNARSIRTSAPERLLREQATLPPELTHSAQPDMDIWSLGVVFYQMVTGHFPFQGGDDTSTASAIINKDPTFPSHHRPQLPKEVEQLILKTLEKEPQSRPKAEELIVELENVAVRLDAKWIYQAAGPLNDVKPSTKPTKPKTSPKSSQKSWPLSWSQPLLIVALVELLVIGLLFWLWQSNSARQPTDTSATPTTTLVSTPLAVGQVMTPKITNTPTAPAPTAPLTATVAAVATITPLPTETFTPEPTETFTPTLTEIPIPIPATVAAPLFVTSVRLLRPANGAIVPGQQTYCWEPDGPLPPGGAYEVAIWKAEQDWNKEGLAQGIYGTINTKTEAGWCIVDVDVSRLIAEGAIGNINKSQQVRWGVFMVTSNERRYLQAQRDITFE